jgi:hypothetical protein
MTITLDLPPETEAKLREQAATQGAKLEEYLSELAQHWASGNGTSPAPVGPPKEKTPEQRIAEWREFVASHDYITAVADDSRESIYEGCGE